MPRPKYVQGAASVGALCQSRYEREPKVDWLVIRPAAPKIDWLVVSSHETARWHTDRFDQIRQVLTDAAVSRRRSVGRPSGTGFANGEYFFAEVCKAYLKLRRDHAGPLPSRPAVAKLLSIDPSYFRKLCRRHGVAWPPL